MQLNLNYLHKESMGYGRFGVELARALTEQGVTVYDQLPGPGRADGLAAAGRTPGLAGSVLWVCTPPQADGWWSTQVSDLFTMWEATRLPESFRENLHNFRRILVPSQQNLDLFSEYHPDVHLVLLGVDPAAWHYVPRTEPGLFFDFLIGGSGNAREPTSRSKRSRQPSRPTRSPARSPGSS